MKQQFRLHPATGRELPFSQRIELLLDGRVAGVVHWFSPRTDDGVFQVLDLIVDEPRRRQGFGTLLLKKAYAEAAELFAATGVSPRRVWVCLEQKRHVVARAFLTKHGYQHTSTLAALYRDQDGMVYQRTFD